MRPRAAAVALLAPWLLAGGAGAAAKQDPWARVPPLPTGCYQADGYLERLEAAREAVARDLDRQQQINDELSEKINSIDPMELASRQQQYMMEHPQEAMELMQRYQQISEGFAEEGVLGQENRLKLEEERVQLDARYQAALDSRIEPIRAKFKDLDVKAQPHLVPLGETWVYPPWAVEESNALTLQENAAYEKVCAEWWAASGPFHGWLKRYRDLLEEEIPRREEAENIGAGFMVQIVGTPTKSFAPTARLAVVKEFMEKASALFERRRREPGRTQEVVR